MPGQTEQWAYPVPRQWVPAPSSDLCSPRFQRSVTVVLAHSRRRGRPRFRHHRQDWRQYNVLCQVAPCVFVRRGEQVAG
jgi:hypothetical protein